MEAKNDIKMPYLLQGLASQISLSFSNVSNISHDYESFIEMEGNSLFCEDFNVAATKGIIFKITDANVFIKNSKMFRNLEYDSNLLTDFLITSDMNEIFNVTFIDNDFSIDLGFSIKIMNIYSVFILNCNFLGYDNGKGVELYDVEHCMIENSSFVLLTNLENGGGALFFSCFPNSKLISFISILNCTF